MKNLFEYATKELSQDAFLCWLFANFDCEQEEVKDFSCYVLSWLISDKLSLENIRQIKNVKILKQYKKIDILVECTFLDIPYIIVIEDKTCSTAHNRQLDRYRETVNSLYNSTYQKRFIFFKTDIIGKEEDSDLKTYNGWKIKQTKEIHEAFTYFLKGKNLCEFNNEILHYYYDNLTNIYNAIINRPQKVSDWKLYSWHSFFEDYIPIDGLVRNTEIRAYQKQYYYYKFTIAGHAEDLPSIEVRSRDYNKDNGKLKFRVVIYNVTPSNITEKNITEWKNELCANAIKVCNRKDISKNKQIGIFERTINGDNEFMLIQVFNDVGNLLLRLYDKTY